MEGKMTMYVLHITFVTHLLRPGSKPRAVKEYFTYNRRLALLKQIFEEELNFRNVELFTGLSPSIYQSGFGFTEHKSVFLRKRNYVAHGGRSIIPRRLYAFATVYSTNPHKLQRLGNRLIEIVDELRKKHTILQAIFVYPEIRKAKEVNTRRWDSDAYKMYKSGVRDKNIKIPAGAEPEEKPKKK